MSSGSLVVVALGREAVLVGAMMTEVGKCNRANWKEGGTRGGGKHKHRKDSDCSP